MINPISIFKGWFYSLVYAPKHLKRLSFDRLQQCHGCVYAMPSKVLKFMKGNANEINVSKCDFCGCPVVEKSLVKEEKCELNKWKR